MSIETMGREDFINNEFLTVSGRSKNAEEFAETIKKNLFDNFEIVSIHELGEFGIDDKERFLAFISRNSEIGQDFSAQRIKLVNAGLGAYVHENLEKAYEYSRKNYPTFGEKEEKIARKIDEIKEKFPKAKAAEIEQFNILEALWAAGNISFVRCLFDGEPCIALVSVVSGADELRVRPLAILLNEMIEIKLEFPTWNTDEE